MLNIEQGISNCEVHDRFPIRLTSTFEIPCSIFEIGLGHSDLFKKSISLSAAAPWQSSLPFGPVLAEQSARCAADSALADRPRRRKPDPETGRCFHPG